jgi:hypothetical protein
MVKAIGSQVDISIYAARRKAMAETLKAPPLITLLTVFIYLRYFQVECLKIRNADGNSVL